MVTKPIRNSDHLETRLELRSIDSGLTERVIREADRLLFDIATGYRIALATIPYREAPHLMMIAFDETEDEIVAVTIHPLEEKDVMLKLRSGRWKQ